MLHMLGVWFISAVCLLITAYFVPGFKINTFGSALIAVLIIGFFNMFLRPLLLLLSLPINILTLGLFTFVVNAVILKIAAGLMNGFEITSWTSAIIGALVLAIVQSLMFWLLSL